MFVVCLIICSNELEETLQACGMRSASIVATNQLIRTCRTAN